MLYSLTQNSYIYIAGFRILFRGRGRTFLHGTVNWISSKHAQLRGSGGMAPQIFFGKFAALRLNLMGLATYSIPTIVTLMDSLLSLDNVTVSSNCRL